MINYEEERVLVEDCGHTYLEDELEMEVELWKEALENGGTRVSRTKAE